MRKKLLILAALLLVGSVSAMEQGDVPKNVWEGRLRPRPRVVGFAPLAGDVALCGDEAAAMEDCSPIADDRAGGDQHVSLDHALVRFESIKKEVAAAQLSDGAVDLEKIEKVLDDSIDLLGALIRNRVCFGLDAEVENHEQCKEEHDSLLEQRCSLRQIRKDCGAGLHQAEQNLIAGLQRQIFGIQLTLTAALGRAYTDRDVEAKIEELERLVAQEPGNRLTPLREKFLSILKRVVELCEAERKGIACNINMITLCTDLMLLAEAIAALQQESDAADVVTMAEQVDVLTKILEKRLPGGRSSDLMVERGIVFAWKVLVPLTMKLSQLCERKAAPYQLAADPVLKERGRRLSCLGDCCCGASVVLSVGVLALVGLGYFVVPDATLTTFFTLFAT